MRKELGRALASAGLAFLVANCAVEGPLPPTPTPIPAPPSPTPSIPRHEFREVLIAPGILRTEWSDSQNSRMTEEILAKVGARHHILDFDEVDRKPFLYIFIDPSNPVVPVNGKATIYQESGVSISQLASNIYKIGMGRDVNHVASMDQVLKVFNRDCGPVNIGKTRADTGRSETAATFGVSDITRYFITKRPSCFSGRF